MKTLVIHPDDISTSFLTGVYADKAWTVIKVIHIAKKTLLNAIKAHDRIVMLGHGTQDGLFAKGKGRLVDSTFVPSLIDKEIVAIWCNADKFVEKYDLKGFYTGMIISEMGEAYICNVNANYKEINQSNALFTKAIAKSIDTADMLTTIKKEYNGLNSRVLDFNATKLYKR